MLLHHHRRSLTPPLPAQQVKLLRFSITKAKSFCLSCPGRSARHASPNLCPNTVGKRSAMSTPSAWYSTNGKLLTVLPTISGSNSHWSLLIISASQINCRRGNGQVTWPVNAKNCLSWMIMSSTATRWRRSWSHSVSMSKPPWMDRRHSIWWKSSQIAAYRRQSLWTSTCPWWMDTNRRVRS